MSYTALSRFAAPAVPRSEFWRTAVGLAAIAGLYWLGMALYLGIVASMTPPAARMTLVRDIAGGHTPQSATILLGSFLPLLAAVVFVTRALHRRPARTLLGPNALRVAWQTSVPLVGLALVMVLIAIQHPDVGRSTPMGVVLKWAPVALPMIAVQIAAEEVLFRGYLQQQMRARSANPLLWMVLPSALFGVLHADPATYGPNWVWPVIWAALFGCLAADLTARTGNLGAALALHLVNNISAIMMLGVFGNLDGLAAYTIVLRLSDTTALTPWMIIDAAQVIVGWLIVRVALRV